MVSYMYVLLGICEARSSYAPVSKNFDLSSFQYNRPRSSGSCSIEGRRDPVGITNVSKYTLAQRHPSIYTKQGLTWYQSYIIRDLVGRHIFRREFGLDLGMGLGGSAAVCTRHGFLLSPHPPYIVPLGGDGEASACFADADWRPP
jgi:hypothetical protein